MSRLLAGLAFLMLVAAPAAQAGDTADLIARGKYLATAADCVGCHTSDPAKPFAGGVALQTPFGTIVTPNITPDPDAGIGNWTDDDFLSALWRGRGKDGKRLFPAMPYPSYTEMSREDALAIRAYLRKVVPMPTMVESNQLPFPFSIRLNMLVWNALYLNERRFAPEPSRSAQWNRGRYLVDVLGHCGVCHTPKNVLGGDEPSEYLAGATLQGWHAPNIAPSKDKGIGTWKDEELFALLRTGQSGNEIASGPMAEVIKTSTSQLTDDDLNAIIAYLKDKP
jgi:mono/diheme cytochrome c family protein